MNETEIATATVSRAGLASGCAGVYEEAGSETVTGGGGRSGQQASASANDGLCGEVGHAPETSIGTANWSGNENAVERHNAVGIARHGEQRGKETVSCVHQRGKLRVDGAGGEVGSETSAEGATEVREQAA